MVELTCYINGCAVGDEVFEADHTGDARAITPTLAKPQRHDRDGVDSQRPQRKQKHQRKLLLRIQAQILQLPNRQQHNHKVLKNTKPGRRIHKRLRVRAPPPDGVVPHRLHGHALQDDDEAEGERVARHPGDADFDDETEFLGREDAQEEEEDGEFGEGLDDDVEDLGDVVELW
jgi:hypothetical protein